MAVARVPVGEALPLGAPGAARRALDATRDFCRRRPLGAIGAAAILTMLIVAMLAPLLAPYDPVAVDFSGMLARPSAKHWLGTDSFGRDVLSRLIAGSRISVLGALEAVGVALLLGVGPGMASAWFGRRLEWLALRITDTRSEEHTSELQSQR